MFNGAVQASLYSRSGVSNVMADAMFIESSMHYASKNGALQISCSCYTEPVTRQWRATCSAIMIVVRFVGALGTNGMIDASTTIRSRKPWTRPNASTAPDPSKPIGTVEVGCW